MEKVPQTIRWCSPSGALEKDCKLASIMDRMLLLDQARMETKLGRQSPTSIWANSRGKVQEKQPMTVEASLVTLLLTVMLLHLVFYWIPNSDLGYYAEKLTSYFSIRKKSFQGPVAGNKCRTGHHWRQRKQTEAVWVRRGCWAEQSLQQPSTQHSAAIPNAIMFLQEEKGAHLPWELKCLREMGNPSAAVRFATQDQPYTWEHVTSEE